MQVDKRGYRKGSVGSLETVKKFVLLATIEIGIKYSAFVYLR